MRVGRTNGLNQILGGDAVAVCVAKRASSYGFCQGFSPGAIERGRSYIRALTSADLHDALPLELAIGLAHGVGIHPQLHRELPHGRQRVVGPQVAEDDSSTHLIDDLDIDRAGIIGVDSDEHVKFGLL